MLITRILISTLLISYLHISKAQTTDSLTIPIVNYAQLQERYFDIRGDSTIIINFWASWCMPCRAEMPYFEQLRQEFASKKVKIVLATIDANHHIETKVKPFLIQSQIKLEVIAFQDKISPIKLLPLFCPNWSGSIPITIVMNQTDGTYFETSFNSYEELKKAVLPYIK
jgi:thiol-disulfide isomerase/thioredoxin